MMVKKVKATIKNVWYKWLIFCKLKNFLNLLKYIKSCLIKFISYFEFDKIKNIGLLLEYLK